MLRQVLELVYQGYADLHNVGAYWRDADGDVRHIKVYLGPHLADGKEAASITGLLGVSHSPAFHSCVRDGD